MEADPDSQKTLPLLIKELKSNPKLVESLLSAVEHGKAHRDLTLGLCNIT